MKFAFWNDLPALLGRCAPSKYPRYAGRWPTCDAAFSPEKKPLAEQEQAWLGRSCLVSRDLPGQLLPTKNARTVELFDIDGTRIPEADIMRRFRPVNGFGALTDAATLEPQPKYLHPSGIRPHLYYPQNGSNHWRDWARDSKQRKIFVEGCAKAACANKFGFASVGIEGCWGWRSVKHGLLLLPEFNDYELEDSDVYWIPDRDRNPKAVADILRASNAFAFLLRGRGARPHVVWFDLLEGFDKVGVDDFLFHYSRGGKDLKAGSAALEDVIANTPVWEDFEISDLGNARRWVRMYGESFRFVAPRRWLVYREGCWRDDDRLEHQETCKSMFEGLLDDARYAGNSERSKLLRVHVTRSRIDNVPGIAKSDPAIIVTPDRLDRHPLFVNCRNGTLEMPNDEHGAFRFRPASPEDLLTRAVSVSWSPEASCPVFLGALEFWTKKDKQLQRTIQQLLGLSCTGVVREQLFIILYGPGATGKSTLIEIVREILANYAVTLESDTFLVRRHGKPEERKLAPLLGARFASSSETERSGVLDENLIKLLAGEDSVAARRLYEEQFDFTPQAKIWLRTNHRPEIRGMGNDIWRRVVALPFGQIVPPEKRDRFLKDKLRAELEGIFVWMVNGYLDYAKHGLVLASAITEAIDEYKKEQDIMSRFFEEDCEFRPQDFTDTKVNPRYSIGREELYQRFRTWCEKSQVRTVPNVVQFKSEIKNRFANQIQEKKISVTVWVIDRDRTRKKKKQQEWRWVGVTTKFALNSPLVRSAR